MESNLKNYTPVYIGVGIGVGVGLLACLVTYLLMRYQKSRAILQLKIAYEKDKQNALDAVISKSRLESLKAKKDYLAHLAFLKADTDNLNEEKEIVTEQIIE